MARGRKPEAAGVKAAKGNTRRQKSAPVAPEIQPVGALPGYMTLRRKKLTDKGRRVRIKMDAIAEHLKKRLETINFLKETDVNGFFRYCRYMADWLVCLEILDEEGEFYLAKSDHNPEGIWRRHPVTLSIRVAEQNLRMLEAEFGMTPARRQQLLLQLASGGLGVPQKATETQAHAGGEEAGLFPQGGPIGMGARSLPH